jgi:stearoyl-CoA desaturase (delta-9 desaturase)
MVLAIVIFLIVHWYSSLFYQTFFLHRYAAHGMFTMNKFWERFFYFFGYLTQGASYLSPYAYGVLHRMHHSFADTEKDPHSPVYDKNPLAMMWRTRVLYAEIFKEKIEVEEKYTKGVPKLLGFERFADHVAVRLIWVGIYIGAYVLLDAPLWMYIFIPVHALMGPLHGVIINWGAHKYGYRNFEVSDTSKNLMPWDLFMFGEGLHNNHHTYGARANFAVKKWEFDPCYPFIKIFNGLGIIKLRKTDGKVAWLA